MKNLLMTLGLACMLVACGTSVPLSDVPVSDATAKPVTGPNTPAGTGSVNSSTVAPVSLADVPSPDKAVLSGRIVYFDYDSFVIKPEFQGLIADHAKYIRAQSGNALSILGVPQGQMEAVSFGKEKPAVAGTTEEAYAKNRRTEIRYP